MPIIETALNDLIQQATHQSHRYWVWISGDETWCLKQAAQFKSQHSCISIEQQNASQLTSTPDLASKLTPESTVTYTPKQAKALLGSESEHVIYNSFSSALNADALAISAGTVKAGGLFILLTPEAKQWEQQPALPDNNASGTTKHSPFIERLCNILSNDAQCYKIQQNTALAALPDARNVLNTQNAQYIPAKTKDQFDAINAIKHVVTGHRRRPLVMIADRGRGKTSALGIACAQLMTQGLKNILVTAPQWTSVASLFQQLQHLLPQGSMKKHSFYFNDQCVMFMPIDQIIRDKPPTDLLLVDEAAAFPAPLLGHLLHYSRVVFSTTVQGYEGSGKGFQIRFFNTLDQKTPQWKKINLDSPIRWNKNDPLEQSLYSALLFSSPPNPTLLPPIETIISELSGSDLIKNEKRLTQLFGLLVQAHYQTTPADLQAILDTPNSRCITIENAKNQQIVGVVFYVIEEPLSDELCTDVWLGKRRPKGQLLIQSLASHSGFQQAGKLTGMRIVRIAVEPELQRSGIGKQLLNAAKITAQQQHLDFIGSSFAATTDVMDFWSQQRYTIFRLGLHLDASSGTHSAMVWQPLSTNAEQLNQKVQVQWSKQLSQLLPQQFNQLPYSIIRRLVCGATTNIEIDAQDWADIYSYGFGLRGFDQVTYALNLCVSLYLKTTNNESSILELDEISQQLIAQAILQQQPWSNIAKTLNFTGKKAIDQSLRKIVKSLYTHLSPEK